MILQQMLGFAPAKAEDVLDQFQKQYNSLVRSGDYSPFVWPYRVLGPHLLILYLLLPPTTSRLVNWARYPVFAIIVYLSISVIQECRSSSVTVAYGIGLLNAWTILWSATFLIFNDARKNFKRVERRVHDQIEEEDYPADKGAGFTSGRDVSCPAELQARHPNGSSPNRVASRMSDPYKLVHNEKSAKIQQSSVPTSGPDMFTWQHLPQNLSHRLDWVADLVTNFRGLGWNHQVSGTLPPPPHIQASLHYPNQPPENNHVYPSRMSLLRINLLAFLVCCMALDILKAVTSRDPYFWSLPPSVPSPFPYPRAFRVFFSLIYAYTALQTIFLLPPLGFACLLGPETIGDHASPWLYPHYFGSPAQVWRKGLAGLWGEWWHQLFRYAFEAAGEFIGGDMLGLTKTSSLGSLVRVVIAFLCSGALHACASYTTLGNTKPIQGAFAFFAVQSIGIIAQRSFTGLIRKWGWREKIPTWIRGAGNIIVVVVWCWLTGPLVADDFAAGGIWLFEPLPISPVRRMMGEGWWRWSGTWARWHSGDRWWQSGLAF